ncbi:MAG: hypothetical protein ABR521_02745 [Gaiellaceae bacterium]
MTPALVIVLAFEAAPRVVADCLSDSEGQRLVDWIESRPELLELVKRALELQEEARAA